MLHTIKSILTYPPASFPRSISSNLSRKPYTHKMDKNKTQNPSEEATHGDVMSHSFGEGYATRSDEEGFGGIYGGNQSPPDKTIHENHPAYDKTQGSEVKEKEKARHQTSANA
ncbi:PREDICTED: uncharacterized protein LOC109348691 isoform X2 [Lupinus angustifolius]|uniref:uncharacterized protein LOC109348691 isoform X2 n=1 Tax=Lupinus angustifolius TaxID=3871 RepID=UPI00092F972D|nr:PREDICTED: uncharacterized protein LOC109348691 isoform X2 [Lupinus angustifolius]